MFGKEGEFVKDEQLRAAREVVTELAGASTDSSQSFKLKILVVVVVVVVEGDDDEDDTEAKRVEVGGERMEEEEDGDGEEKGEEDASPIIVERVGCSGGLRKFTSRLEVTADDEESKNSSVADDEDNGGKGELGVTVDACGKRETVVVEVAVQM